MKVIHLLRAMEFVPNEDTSEIQLKHMQDRIGQGIFEVPGVFGYYSPLYSAPGSIRQAQMVSPEGELNTAPYMVNFLNGITKLIDDGLSNCNGGWAHRTGGNCGYAAYVRKYHKINKNHNGMLTYTTDKLETLSEDIIQEMNLLMTGGRMPVNNSKVIIDLYEKSAQSGGIFNCKCYLRKVQRRTGHVCIHSTRWSVGNYSKLQLCLAPLDTYRR